jgi:hypothetical protein
MHGTLINNHTKIDRYARLPNVTSNYLMRYKYAKYTHYNDSI